MLNRRIAPADQEGLNSVVTLIFDDAFFRREIVDIGLVDLGRDDEQRDLMHLILRRRVLNQLHHLSPVDDGPG